MTPLIGKLCVHVQGYVDREEFYISPLSTEDVILGAPWFHSLAAKLEFPNRTISFQFGNKDISIHTKDRGSTISIVSHASLQKSMKSNLFAYMIFSQESKPDSLSVDEKDQQMFLNSFKDCFADENPKELPPSHGEDDHKIDLVSGSSPPNRPPYRLDNRFYDNFILKACGMVKDAEIDKRIHDDIMKQGLSKKNIVLGNALVDMYVRCVAPQKAQKVIEELLVGRVVSWSALIVGYLNRLFCSALVSYPEGTGAPSICLRRSAVFYTSLRSAEYISIFPPLLDFAADLCQVRMSPAVILQNSSTPCICNSQLNILTECRRISSGLFSDHDGRSYAAFKQKGANPSHLLHFRRKKNCLSPFAGLKETVEKVIVDDPSLESKRTYPKGSNHLALPKFRSLNGSLSLLIKEVAPSLQLLPVQEVVEDQSAPPTVEPSNSSSTESSVVYVLAAINIAVYLFGLASPVDTSGMGTSTLPLLYGAKVNELLLNGEWWRLITPMFLHSGFFHIALRSWALLFFGPQVENVFGPLAFCTIYFLGGLCGNIFSFFFTPAATVGGTGPLFTLFSAWAVYLWQNKRVLGEQSADYYEIKATTMMGVLVLCLSCLLPIDEWIHVGAVLPGILFGSFAAPILQADVDGIDSSERNMENREEPFAIFDSPSVPGLSLVFVLSTGLCFTIYNILAAYVESSQLLQNTGL
ncbi:hypothetical protein L7F22_024085 [Adiantum nelumboides]|nr:hypothetical protein [Adiantum nelumboides]